MDVIAVVVIGHKKLVVPIAGGNDKSASLVREDLSCGLHAGNETHVCTPAFRSGLWKRIGWFTSDWDCEGFGGMLVFAGVVQAALLIMGAKKGQLLAGGQRKCGQL
jgi:hypothetical protein